MGKGEEQAGEDLKLVRASKNGDHEAFNQLVLKYQERIFNTIWRLTGEYETARDLTQDAFLNAYRGLAKFRENASFFTWLFRIAINLGTSARRQYARRKKNRSLTCYDENNELQDWIEPVSTENDPIQSLEEKEREQFVKKAIADMEEPFRNILVLRDIEGLSYEEIQEILECPIGTVRSRIHRARLMIKDKLVKFL